MLWRKLNVFILLNSMGCHQILTINTFRLDWLLSNSNEIIKIAIVIIIVIGSSIIIVKTENTHSVSLNLLSSDGIEIGKREMRIKLVPWSLSFCVLSCITHIRHVVQLNPFNYIIIIIVDRKICLDIIITRNIIAIFF